MHNQAIFSGEGRREDGRILEALRSLLDTFFYSSRIHLYASGTCGRRVIEERDSAFLVGTCGVTISLVRWHIQSLTDTGVYPERM